MMSVLVRNNEMNQNTLYVKGAAERIIYNSTSYLDSEGNKQQMTEEIKKSLNN